MERGRAPCSGCGRCEETCYVHAISVVGGKAGIDQELCKGCARCAHACPERAITLHMADADHLHRTVSALGSLVDVSRE